MEIAIWFLGKQFNFTIELWLYKEYTFILSQERQLSSSIVSGLLTIQNATIEKVYICFIHTMSYSISIYSIFNQTFQI